MRTDGWSDTNGWNRWVGAVSVVINGLNWISVGGLLPIVGAEDDVEQN